MKCPYCDKRVTKIERREGKVYMVAVEKPHMNLFFHKVCLEKVEDDLEGFIRKWLENDNFTP